MAVPLMRSTRWKRPELRTTAISGVGAKGGVTFGSGGESKKGGAGGAASLAKKQDTFLVPAERVRVRLDPFER